MLYLTSENNSVILDFSIFKTISEAVIVDIIFLKRNHSEISYSFKTENFTLLF
jgi:hypothetical protein